MYNNFFTRKRRQLILLSGTFARLFYDKTIFLLTLILSIGMLLAFAYIQDFSSTLVSSSALYGANHYSKAIQEFRSIYTSEVVVRAQRQGIEVTHDYLNNQNALPLPATLSLLFGKKVGDNDTGFQVRLFSNYSFPWRKDAGPTDLFEKEALNFLLKEPAKPFYRFETLNNNPVLRFATADLMRADCVNCHNTHPDSPKKDWKEGDVVGVVEIIQPMKQIVEKTKIGIRGAFLLLATLCLLAIFGLSLVIKRLRWEAAHAHKLFSRTKESHKALQLEIIERRKAEEDGQKLEQQMQHVQKLESLGVLAGGIAHDFNNLLMGIMGNAGLALLELPQNSSIRKRLDQIKLATERAAELTNQLLAYSGKGKFVVKPLNISHLATEMSSLLETIISKKAILHLNLDPNLPMIDGDPSQIRQVLMNLITNASDALGSEIGEIFISTSILMVDKHFLETTYVSDNLPEGKYVCFEVRDTGIGMDKSTLSKIFDPFFSTKFTGRGLGLAAVLGIVRGHRGTLRVESVLGEGTIFQVLFPCSKEISTTSSLESTTQPEPLVTHGQILVVDDEESCLEITKDILQHYGFTVITAIDGLEALSVYKAKQKEIAAILLDLTMPHQDGEETLREIRKLDPTLPVILMSGYNEQSASVSLLTDSNTKFLHKPFRPGQLIEKLEHALIKDHIESAQKKLEKGKVV